MYLNQKHGRGIYESTTSYKHWKYAYSLRSNAGTKITFINDHNGQFHAACRKLMKSNLSLGESRGTHKQIVSKIHQYQFPKYTFM